MTNVLADLDRLRKTEAEVIPWGQLPSDRQRAFQRLLVPKDDHHRPKYYIVPDTVAALATVMAYAKTQQLSVLTFGNGTKCGWGGLGQSAQLIVSTQRLNRLREHAVGDLTVTVEAGMQLVDLQNILQPHGQFLPLDPAYPAEATLGGIVATADAGSWRQRYGGVRDLVLGLSFVRADGAIAKAGGRVVKNVAGYDLMKLLTGSYGTLGILSEITFRLYPLPEASATVLLNGESVAIAQAAQMIRSSSLTPMAAEILSSGLISVLDTLPGLGLALRFQTIPASIAEQLQQVEAIAQSLNVSTYLYQDEQEKLLWRQLNQSTRAPTHPEAVGAKFGLIPTQAIAFLEALTQLTGEQGFATINLSSGVGYLQLVQDVTLGPLTQLRSLCQSHQGYLTVLDAPSSLKQQFEPWGYTGNALGMMRVLKRQFDPDHRLNPGRFVGGI